MAGMKFKSFPLMGTWLFSAIFLLATFWHSVFRDGWGFLFSVLLFLSMIVYAVLSLVNALFDWSKSARWRFLITGIAVGLFIPVLVVGGYVRDNLFLMGLPEFQAVADHLIGLQPRASSQVVDYSSSHYWKLLLDEEIGIRRGDDKSATILFVTRDSSAVGHAGYLYSSDDNVMLMKKRSPEMEFKKLTPHWYRWVSM